MSVNQSSHNPDIKHLNIDAEYCKQNFKFYLSGLSYHNYVCFDTFADVVGRSLTKRLVRECLIKKTDILTRHLRRGLKIEIYAK